MHSNIKTPISVSRPLSSKKTDSFAETKTSFNRSNRSLNTSRSRNNSIKNVTLNNKSVHDQLLNFKVNNPPLGIYFDTKIRKQYNETLIDSYFCEHKDFQQLDSPIFNRSKIQKPEILDLKRLRVKYIRQTKTSQNIRKRPYLTNDFANENNSIQQQTEQKNHKLQQPINTNIPMNPFQMKEIAPEQNSILLPVIKQKVSFPKRPVSESKNLRNSNLFGLSNNQSLANIALDHQTFSFVHSAHSKQSENADSSLEKDLKDDLQINISLTSGNKQKQKIKRQYKNCFFQTFYVRSNKQKNKIKQFSSHGLELYKRQVKVQKLGTVPVLWQKVAENVNCLKFRYKKSLRQELYTLVQQKQGSEDIFLLYPKKQYFKLFNNNNEWLIDIIVALCRIFETIADKVVHPKININNIYRLGQKKIFVDDWGCSGIKDTLKIRQHEITSYLDPILGNQKDWLVIPQYLAPEILKDLTNWDQRQIWQTSSGTNMWSLGCLIFELLTLTPLWIPFRCKIKGQNDIRKGAMSVQRRNPEHITEKQKSFIFSATRTVKASLSISCQKINPSIIEVMQKCLKLNAKQRITPKEAINILGH